MDSEVKAKLIEALRSGKYPQSRQVLRSQEGFCCMGVLCDIVAPDGWMESDGFFYHGGGATAFPDKAVLKAAGAPVTDDDNESRHLFWKLVEMNDDDKSFNEIADYIEANM